MAKYLICKGESGIQMHALIAMYPRDDGDFFVAELPTCISVGRNGTILSALNEKREFARRESGGGVLLLDEGIIVLALNGNIRDLLIRSLHHLGIDVSIENNDIIVGDKKVAGMAEYNNDGRRTNAASLIVDTPKEKFDEYLKPTYKHNTEKVSDRITSLKLIKPSITKQEVIDTLLTVYKSIYTDSEAIDLGSIVKTDEYIKKYKKHSSELWIKHGLSEEDAYFVHNVKIDGEIVNSAKMGTTADGKSTLSLSHSTDKICDLLEKNAFVLTKIYKHKVYDEYKIEEGIFRTISKHKYTNCIHYVLEEVHT